MNGLRKLACYNPGIVYSLRAEVPKRFTVKVRISGSTLEVYLKDSAKERIKPNIYQKEP